MECFQFTIYISHTAARSWHKNVQVCKNRSPFETPIPDTLNVIRFRSLKGNHLSINHQGKQNISRFYCAAITQLCRHVSITIVIILSNHSYTFPATPFRMNYCRRNKHLSWLYVQKVLVRKNNCCKIYSRSFCMVLE